MIARSLKAKMLVFAVFFCGIATGVLITNFYESRVAGSRFPEGNSRARAVRDVNKFHDYLGLTQEQRQQVTAILEASRDEFQKLRKETQPRFQAIQQQSREKMREIMTEDQRQKYDEFRKNRDKERLRERERESDRERCRPD